MRIAMLKMAFVFVMLTGCAARKSGTTGENALIGKKWHVQELNGESVTGKANGHRPYLELLPTDGRYTGNAGCNGFMGSYTLQGKNGIRFSPVASTMMACPDLDTERAFVAVMESARSYSLDGGVLTLRTEQGKTLAKLVAAD